MIVSSLFELTGFSGSFEESDRNEHCVRTAASAGRKSYSLSTPEEYKVMGRLFNAILLCMIVYCGV